MMNKSFLICMAGFLLTSAAAAACTSVTDATPVSQTDSSYDRGSEVRLGRVKYIEGNNSFVIEYGHMNGGGDSSDEPDGTSFLAEGRQETVTVPESVPITASMGGVESEAAAYQIGPGTLLRLRYAGGSLLSVTLLNDEPAAFARQVKAAFLSKDIRSLEGLISYPCYIHVSSGGRGWIIKNRKELSALSGILFTDSFIRTLKAFDTAAIKPIQSNVLIGGENGPPAVSFHIDSNGIPGITGISVAD